MDKEYIERGTVLRLINEALLTAVGNGCVIDGKWGAYVGKIQQETLLDVLKTLTAVPVADVVPRVLFDKLMADFLILGRAYDYCDFCVNNGEACCRNCHKNEESCMSGDCFAWRGFADGG